MQLAGRFERRAETRSGCELCHAYVVWCSDTRVVMRDGSYFFIINISSPIIGATVAVRLVD